VTSADLQALFTRPPASFLWSPSEDGRRVIGVTEGVVLDLWPDKAEMTALFPPDREDIAARNGTLMLLLLTATRPDWQSAGDWLTFHLRSAARGKSPIHEETNYTRGVTFSYSRATSRALLRVRQRNDVATP
jgi:hypothetical protein